MEEFYLDEVLRQLSESLSEPVYRMPAPQPVAAEPYYAEPSYSLPTQQPVVAQAVSNALAAPTDERSALLASLPPEYLTGVDVSALDVPTLRNLARSANALSYEQNAAKSGGLYALDNPADYYQAYGSIPISFTGNSGYYDKGVSGPSIDYLTPDANASYTLYSPRSGEVVATGSGVEGLINLAQQANALNAEQGRKADWQLIKTPAEGGAPEVVGSNLFNSDLTTLGKIVATGLPIATAFIPGLNVLGSIAAGAGAGGISAAMQDQNILKGALIGGATAGVMKAPVLNGGKTLEGVIGGALNKVPVVGDTLRGIGNILDLPAAAQRAAEQKATTDIVVNAATKAVPKLVGAGIGSLANAFTPSVVTNPATGEMSLVRQPPVEEPTGALDIGDPNSIVVTGARDVAPVISGIGSGLSNLVTPSPAPTVGPEPRRPDYGDKVEEPAPEEQPIIVTGQRLDNIVNMIANGAYMNEIINAGYSLDEYDAALNKFNADREIVSEGQTTPELPPVPVPVTTSGPFDNVAPPSDTIVAEAQRKAELPAVPVPSFKPGPLDNVALPEDEIVVTRKNEPPVTGIDAIINSVAPSLNAPTMNVPPETPSKKMGVGDYIRLGLLVPPLVKGIGGSGDNSMLPISSGSTLGFTPMNRSFTGGGIGGAAGGTFDPFTYGQALPGAQTAEYEFFQPYRMTAANPTAAYNAALAKFDAYQNDLANQVASGELTPDDAKVMAQSYATNAGYQTTPAVASPEAVPAYKDGGEVDDDMVRHLVEWHKGGGHTGPGKVKGIGSGQEDLIPAWLSDGEYVWSAQDVADLGDGSTDEGVRRLDKMRQMVRRRAGRKDVKKIAKPQRGIDTMLKAVGGSV